MPSLPKKKLAPLPKKKVKPSEKVTPSDDVEKGTNLLNGMEEPVVPIRRNILDNFQGEYAGSTGWLKIDREWLKRKFSIIEPDFYNFVLKRILKVKISKHTKHLYYHLILLR